MVWPNPALAQQNNAVAQAAVGYCAQQTGVSPASTAVGDTRTMMGRFWLEGRVGTGQLDPRIVQNSKRDDVRNDMAKLDGCLAPLAEAAGTGGYYRAGVQAYDAARDLAIRADRNPALVPHLQRMGLMQ